MKPWRRVVFAGLGLAAIFGGGLIAWLALKPVRRVTVVVRNDSEKPIATVRLEHERGVEIVENIAKGDARTMKFIAGGETPYTLRVRFADGSKVTGNHQYANRATRSLKPSPLPESGRMGICRQGIERLTSRWTGPGLALLASAGERGRWTYPE